MIPRITSSKSETWRPLLKLLCRRYGVKSNLTNKRKQIEKSKKKLLSLYKHYSRLYSNIPSLVITNKKILNNKLYKNNKLFKLSSQHVQTSAKVEDILSQCKVTKHGKGNLIDTQLTLLETPPTIPKEHLVPMDGSTAAAYVAYANSEVSFIYPISPATSMGETMDALSSAGKTNVISNQPVRVEVMQSEGGAAGAVHGALAAGCLSSTFTASQGLLLMIPNMYLIAGELMPCVFHVSARTVAKQALCIFNDHSDVMAVRQTGWSMLCSNNPQEVMDLALVSHLSTVKSRVPIVHFFDGNRTSHEISKIHRLPYEQMSPLIRHDLIDSNLRKWSLNPNNPIARGTGQRPDIFFQSNMASERFYRQAPLLIEETMRDLEKITGRRYNLYDYYGDPEAEKVIVVMGSAGETVSQAVKKMVGDGEKVGVVKVRLFRPWSPKHFLASVPKSVKKMAVLDRTREEGSNGEPLFLDVCVTMNENGRHMLITGGQFGIGQKEFTPVMAESAFKNLDSENPKLRYTLGINDDVTFTSLSYPQENDLTMPKGTRQCLFWGLGSDGTVGANKEAIKMIGDNTDLFCQGFFAYDSKKSGGVTMSHLRFGPEPIKAEYQIVNADYIACHNSTFVNKFDVLGPIKKNGIFLLNSPWGKDLEKLEKELPNNMKRKISENDVKFYNIDATKIAQELGLKGRINMIMQTSFYMLGNVLPVDEAISLLKDSIRKVFGSKGEKVVNMNISAVNQTGDNLIEIKYPKEKWLNLKDEVQKIEEWDFLLQEGKPSFVEAVMEPCMSLQGEDLPVSLFEAGGIFPVGTTRYERRGAAPNIPVWIGDKCTQCNYCAIVCPHAVIRPFLLDRDETSKVPKGYEYRKAQGPELAGLNFSIQVAPFDCTGCEVCVESCPDDALYMAPFEEVARDQLPHFEFSMQLPNRNPMDKNSVKGSQFEQPLLEFHAACAGCGETPYVKLITQMFGQEMVIANASGCSSVWGGTCTTHPYTVNKESNKGPAWGRSLFEDNAEYGYGMALASLQRRKRLSQSVMRAIKEENNVDGDLLKLFKDWIKYYDNKIKSHEITNKLNESGLLEKYKNDSSLLNLIYNQRDMFAPQSQWLIGGDGWAYDIGSAGLDHILSKGENVNILVLDTEIYSNTGGQSSKSSVAGQVTKFESLGKTRQKKDLGATAMAYGDVYVASVALGADYNQTVKAFKEAEEYPGTSLIMAYSPCIDWGIDTKDMANIQKVAVDTGYWQLYRYDPRLNVKGLNPLQLDFKKLKQPIENYLSSENRFSRLRREHKERADSLQGQLSDWIQSRHDKIKRQSLDDLELLDFLKQKLGEETSEKIMVLYASETGNAQEFASIVGHELTKRNVRAKVESMDDYDFDNLCNEKYIIFIAATCGQGELPNNCHEFVKNIKREDIPNDWLSDVKTAVFGMGDSHYVYFNEAAKIIHECLENKGASMMLDYGKGDDQDDEKYETAWEDWSPQLFEKMELAEPEKMLLPSTYNYSFPVDNEKDCDIIMPLGAELVPLKESELLTPLDYDRDTRHYEVDISNTKMSYAVGDSLGIYAHNNSDMVDEFLDWYGIKNGDDVIKFEDLDSSRKDPLPENVSAKQLFTQVLDVFGRPKRRFYELLSLTAQDENERNELEKILSPEGVKDYKDFVNETMTHYDLLKKFPTSKPGINYLVDYIPRIKPRLYSIASSPVKKPSQIDMCIVVDDWTTPSGIYKRGLCSNYLTTLYDSENKGGSKYSNNTSHKQDLVVAKVNPGVVSMPDNHLPPLVMVGLGTGLAPIRGMIEDRYYAYSNGEECGPMALFYGARYEKSEFFYKDEFEQANSNNGPLKEIITAFSRDQKEKIYVQDRILQNPQLIYDYLYKQNGYFYACGSSAVNNLKEPIAHCFHIGSNGEISKEQAMEKVIEMQITGRYNIEAW